MQKFAFFISFYIVRFFIFALSLFEVNGRIFEVVDVVRVFLRRQLDVVLLVRGREVARGLSEASKRIKQMGGKLRSQQENALSGVP